MSMGGVPRALTVVTIQGPGGGEEATNGNRLLRGLREEPAAR